MLHGTVEFLLEHRYIQLEQWYIERLESSFSVKRISIFPLLATRAIPLNFP